MIIDAVNRKVYIAIEVFMFASIITITVFSFMGYYSLQSGLRSVHDISNNWGKNPLLNIVQSYSAQCPQDLHPLLEGNEWGGTVHGCDCVGIRDWDIPYEKRNRLNREWCDFNMTIAGCRDVKEVSPVKYSKWKDATLCAKRSNLNFTDFSKYSVVKGRSCFGSFRQCGLMDTLGNVLCVESKSECPINKIIIQNQVTAEPKDHNYTKIALNNYFNLFYTNEAIDQPIITDIKLSEGNVCIDPSEINTNYPQYALDRDISSYKCKTKVNGNAFDTRFKIIDSENKRDLFSQNGITPLITNLPHFPVLSLDATIGIYNRNFIGWKPSCFGDPFADPIIVNKLGDKMDSISSCKVVMCVFSVLMIIYFIGQCIVKWAIYEGNNPVVFNITESGLITLSIIMLITCIVSKGKLGTYATDLENFNCSDELTNDIFMEIGKNFSANASYDTWILILSIYTTFIYIFYILPEFAAKYLSSRREFERQERQALREEEEVKRELETPLDKMPNQPMNEYNNNGNANQNYIRNDSAPQPNNMENTNFHNLPSFNEVNKKD
jgi:hypothetical protein